MSGELVVGEPERAVDRLPPWRRRYSAATSVRIRPGLAAGPTAARSDRRRSRRLTDRDGLDRYASRHDRVSFALMARSAIAMRSMEQLWQRKAQASRMTDEHKAALADGRNQGRAVRRYLEALETNKPKRGRKRTADSHRSATSLASRPSSPPPIRLQRLKLIQEQHRPAARARARSAPTVDLTASRPTSSPSASRYAQRKGISYAAWREVGVAAGRARKAAGISR